MQFYSINVRKFKSIFFQSIFLMLIAIAACFVLVNNSFIILSNFDPNRKFTWPILLAMIVIAVLYSYYRKIKLNRVFDFLEFNDQVEAYERVYSYTMRWYMFSCMVSCFLGVLTARNIFLYYAIFDLLVTLPYYPNRFLFRKELRNDEIIIYQ